MEKIEKLAKEYAEMMLNSFDTNQMSGLENGFIAGYEKAKEWIGTKDRLPDDQRIVLVKTNKDSYSTAYCHGRKSGFIVYGEHAYTEFGDITHWREIE